MYSKTAPPVGQIGELVICPYCFQTINLLDQRDNGVLDKKGTHQIYTTDLVWRAILSIKGREGFKDMDELARYLVFLDQSTQRRILAEPPPEIEPPKMQTPKPATPKQASRHIKVAIVGEEKDGNV